LCVLKLALAGALALAVPIAARADPAGPKTGPGGAGQAASVVQVWDRNGPGGRAAHRVWHQAPGHSGAWNGGGPPHWVANGRAGGWVCCPGPVVPTYWVWGPNGGAFDYPFSDWRGPTGGWGNP